MKKKTKYRLRNNLVLPFWTTISFCISGAVYFGLLFYNSFFATLSKYNEEPIATISFKYKTAQRKFADRVVWDRLKQDSPLYNGDTIHTSALAEATITFVDGNRMDLMENTMAQIFLDDSEGLSAELSDGSLFIDSANAERGGKLSAGGMTISMEAGSAVSASAASEAEASAGQQWGQDNGELAQGAGQEAAAGQSQGQKTSGSKPKAAEKTSAVAFNVINGKASYQSKTGEVQDVSVGEGVSFNVTGDSVEAVKRPSIVVTSPAPNAKLLYHTEGLGELAFNWNTANFEDDVPFTLELSADKSFEKIIGSYAVTDMNSTKVSVKAGTYFWRIRGGETSAAGKLQLIQALPPVQVAPVQDYSYSFRTQKPAVRLIWTETDGASSYRLEISESSDFEKVLITQRSSSASSIISTLGEGVYYWRVTPYFSINREGFAAPSEVKSFRIEKKGSLSVPALFVPLAESIINTDEKAKDMTFSWKLEDEASKYTVVIADNANLSRPKVQRDTTENYLVIKTKDKLLSDGKWYWGVYQTDNEGNRSQISEVQSFYAIKGDLEQHTVEPLNGYKVAANLLRDLKFTWKKNIPETFQTSFQVSKDKDFNDIVYSTKVTGATIKGLNLGSGSYYWRLYSWADDSDINFITPAKQFDVLGPLGASTLTLPGEKAIAREIYPVKFEWDAVEGADFYKFAIYKVKDNSLVYSDNVYDNSTTVDMYGKAFEDKARYRWEILAQASAVPGVVSRRAGTLVQKEFLLVKLKPVEILSPAKNAQINGIDAILKPGVIRWDTVDDVSEAQVVVRKVDVSPAEVVIKVPDDWAIIKGNKVAPKTVPLDNADGIQPGRYEIVVYAKTLDDIDISNTDSKNIGRFTVTPIEPLQSPANVTAVPENLDYVYLAKTRKAAIEFSWNSVPNATEYKIVITDKKGKELFTKTVEKDTKCEFNLLELKESDKIIMQKGTFYYKVEAIRRVDINGDGQLDRILQKGESEKKSFSTNIEKASGAQGKSVKNNYGRAK